MTNQILIETPAEIKRHSLEEMKGYGTQYAASYPHVLGRHLRWLNHHLDEINSATDPEWRQIKVNGYKSLLAVVHVNGQGGSLLS